MNNFMNGRYGADELTTTLGLLGMILALIGSLANVRWISLIALIVIVVALVRALSKNLAARRKENDAFVAWAAKVPGLNKLVAGMGGSMPQGSYATTGRSSSAKADLERTKRTASKMWANRKTTKYFKCKNCGQILSVPKGKGKIRVTCPKCGTKVEMKS